MDNLNGQNNQGFITLSRAEALQLIEIVSSQIKYHEREVARLELIAAKIREHQKQRGQNGQPN